MQVNNTDLANIVVDAVNTNNNAVVAKVHDKDNMENNVDK